jgi:sugar lactone lactonase YvrE
MNLLGQDIQLLAGSTAGHADGVGSSASFRTPMGLALDPEGNLIVADYGNHLIRKVTPAGLVTSVAGSGEIDSSTPGNFGVFRDGTGTAAAFNCPLAVAVDTHGNIFVSDTYNHRIRKITWA